MTKQQLVASVAATIAVGGFVAAGVMLKTADVTVCGGKGCKDITKADYGVLKKGLAGKVEAGTPLTIDEWNELVSVVNEEAKGGMNLGKLDDKKSVRDALVEQLKK